MSQALVHPHDPLYRVGSSFVTYHYHKDREESHELQFSEFAWKLNCRTPIISDSNIIPFCYPTQSTLICIS